MVCRGGGDLHFSYIPYSKLSNQPQLWLRFRKGSQGAGMHWENIHLLRPGQCSWLDRALSGDEPSRIVVHNVNNFSIQWQHQRVAGISSSLPYLSVLVDANRYQSFDVYNDGKGNFIVTGIGQSR